MDWILERTVQTGLAGATFGGEVFSDLDYADDVALLTEMLEVLILSLHFMQEEVRPFGLEINWSKTKIHTTVDPLPTQDMVDSFTYLGSLVDQNIRSEAELVRRIAIARNCMTSLDHNNPPHPLQPACEKCGGSPPH